MTETDYKILQLFWSDPKLGTVIARVAMLALVISIILERKTKIKPWTRLIQWIGKTANQPLIERMDKLEVKVDQLKQDQEAARQESEKRDEKLQNDSELDRATQARRRVLRFSDEISNGMWHSEEAFNDSLEDCDIYESYYSEHPKTKNGKARLAVENIKKNYARKLEEGDFGKPKHEDTN